MRLRNRQVVVVSRPPRLSDSLGANSFVRSCIRCGRVWRTLEFLIGTQVLITLNCLETCMRVTIDSCRVNSALILVDPPCPVSSALFPLQAFCWKQSAFSGSFCPIVFFGLWLGACWRDQARTGPVTNRQSPPDDCEVSGYPFRKRRQSEVSAARVA
jgi:hypothetical protein